MTAEALRTLENPPARLPWPAHLTHTTPYNEPRALAQAVRNGLTAYGLRPRDVERLNIAYPHKHPRKRHFNKAADHALSLQFALERLFRRVDLPIAHAIHETVHLGRSENGTALHALTGRQVHDTDPALQDEPLPFLTTAGARGEAFVLTDWTVSQGTTVASLASYIMHNGGLVLAVTVPFGAVPLQPLAGGGQPARLSGLSAQFQRAAAREKSAPGYDADECAALFDRALAGHGRALATLTDGECRALARDVPQWDRNFSGLLETLGLPAAAQRAFIAARRAGPAPA